MGSLDLAAPRPQAKEPWLSPPGPLPLLRDDEVRGPTLMELEAEPLPEPPVQVPDLEPMVPPLEETVSSWRKGSVREKAKTPG